MISKEEVEHIAKLARLELTDVEIKKMQKDLSGILDYFNVLKKAPKSSRSLASGQVPNQNLRIDEAKDSKIADKLINSTPNKKDGYIKVKAIL